MKSPALGAEGNFNDIGDGLEKFERWWHFVLAPRAEGHVHSQPQGFMEVQTNICREVLQWNKKRVKRWMILALGYLLMFHNLCFCVVACAAF